MLSILLGKISEATDWTSDEDIHKRISKDREYFQKSALMSKHNLHNHISDFSLKDSRLELTALNQALKSEQDKLNTMRYDSDLNQTKLKQLKSNKSFAPVETDFVNLCEKNLNEEIDLLKRNMSDQEIRMQGMSRDISELKDHIKISKRYTGLDLSFLAVEKEYESLADVVKMGRGYDQYTSSYKDMSFRGNLPLFAAFNYFSGGCFCVSYAGKLSEKDFSRSNFCVTKGGEPYRKDAKSLPEALLVAYKHDGDMRLKEKEDKYWLGDSDGRYLGLFYAKFAGAVPKSVKSRVEKAKEFFGDQIYLIAEAKNYEAKPIVQNDALIIGVKHNHAYIIDALDCALENRK